MARTTESLTFITIDTDKLPPAVTALWSTYQKSLTATNVARAASEKAIVQTMTAAGQIPEGMEARFSYKWGKAAVAFVPEGSGTAPGVSGGKLIIGAKGRK